MDVPTLYMITRINKLCGDSIYNSTQLINQSSIKKRNLPSSCKIFFPIKVIKNVWKITHLCLYSHLNVKILFPQK